MRAGLRCTRSPWAGRQTRGWPRGDAHARWLRPSCCLWSCLSVDRLLRDSSVCLGSLALEGRVAGVGERWSFGISVADEALANCRRCWGCCLASGRRGCSSLHCRWTSRLGDCRSTRWRRYQSWAFAGQPWFGVVELRLVDEDRFEGTLPAVARRRRSCDGHGSWCAAGGQVGFVRAGLSGCVRRVCAGFWGCVRRVGAGFSGCVRRVHAGFSGCVRRVRAGLVPSLRGRWVVAFGRLGGRRVSTVGCLGRRS